ncbi:MAG: BrnT family toxin [Burkholderiaceae bacterium]
MAGLKFEWDKKKASANAKKHKVTFDEAKSVFYDERARLIDDPVYSDDEERFVLLGMSSAVRTLVVVHCCRESESTIRLISARKATRAEIQIYDEFSS